MSDSAQSAPPADFYVAANGNDAWSGKMPTPNEMRTDGPFASIQRAQKAVRDLRASAFRRPITVLIRVGTYTLVEPLVFTPEDSGTQESPTIYRAWPGEKPVLSGGRVIKGWKKTEGGLWYVSLPEVQSGKWYFGDLYVNGQRRPRPRLPKEGFYHIEQVVEPEARNKFQYRKGDLKRFHNMSDVEVVIFNAWDELRLRIADLDEKARVVTFSAANNWKFGQWEPNNRFYVENVWEGESPAQPGEWYMDRQTGILYYHPLPGEDMTKAHVVAPVLEELVVIQADRKNKKPVESLEFHGLTFAYTGWQLPEKGHVPVQAEYTVRAAINADGAISCSIRDCEFVHLGKYAIELARGCRGNRVTGNHIHDMGAGGIKIGQPIREAQDADKTESNQVMRNHIHDLGKTYLCAVGVWIGGSGKNLISYNHIHDLNYSGISVGWTWGYGPSLAAGNIIEHNHIHDLGKGLLSDMGGIYTLGVSPGTVLRYNLIHDVLSYSYGGWGIYFDEGSTDILAENNIVYNTKTGGFHQHYGKNNVVRNNVFAFATQAQIQRSRPEQHTSFTFERNIVYWNGGPLFHGNLADYNFRFDRNVYWNTAGEVQFPAGWKEHGMDVNSLVADPLFMNAGKFDFRLKPNSPALKLGFEPIEGAGD